MKKTTPIILSALLALGVIGGIGYASHFLTATSPQAPTNAVAVANTSVKGNTSSATAQIVQSSRASKAS